jgi:hypothetical protein
MTSSSNVKSHSFASACMISSVSTMYYCFDHSVFVLIPLLLLVGVCIIIKPTRDDDRKSSSSSGDNNNNNNTQEEDSNSSSSNNNRDPLSSDESVQYQIQMLNWRIFINKLLTIHVLKMEFRQTCCSLDKVKQFIDKNHSNQQNKLRLNRRKSWSC